MNRESSKIKDLEIDALASLVSSFLKQKLEEMKGSIYQD